MSRSDLLSSYKVTNTPFRASTSKAKDLSVVSRKKPKQSATKKATKPRKKGGGGTPKKSKTPAKKKKKIGLESRFRSTVL